MDAYECLTAPPFASCCNPRWCNKKHTFCAGHFGQIPSKLHQTPALEFEAPAVQLWFIIITMILSMLILCCLSLIYCPVILQETTNDFFHTNAGWPWWWSGGIPLPSWSRCTSQPSRSNMMEKLRISPKDIHAIWAHFHSCVPRRAHARGRACRRKRLNQTY